MVRSPPASGLQSGVRGPTGVDLHLTRSHSPVGWSLVQHSRIIPLLLPLAEPISKVCRGHADKIPVLFIETFANANDDQIAIPRTSKVPFCSRFQQSRTRRGSYHDAIRCQWDYYSIFLGKDSSVLIEN